MSVDIVPATTTAPMEEQHPHLEMSPPTKVVALVDIDCFECQAWQRMYPQEGLWGKPCVVSDKCGRIVSVTYEAKALGISRDNRLREAEMIAKRANAKLHVFKKPQDREKPDAKTTRYASYEIVDALEEYVNTYLQRVPIEMAGSDEFYLDLTEEIDFRLQNKDIFILQFDSQTFLEGKEGKIQGALLQAYLDTSNRLHDGGHDLLSDLELKLMYGGALMQDISNYIFSKTKFVSSTGVGTNKLLAKIAVSLNKPNGITILPETSLPRVSSTISIEKIPGLGGKTGCKIKESFKVGTMGELMQIGLEDLSEVIGQEKAVDVFMKSKGIFDENVNQKVMNFEVSCGKNFNGEISSDAKLQYHVRCLCEEMYERLEEEDLRHKRKPRVLRATVAYIRTNRPRATSEDENLSCNCFVENLNRKNDKDVAEEVLESFFENVMVPINGIKITRISLTAKGLRTIEDNEEK